MDAVSGATERPCPHRSRAVTQGYEDIYSRSTLDAKICQSGISPKVGKNPLIVTINSQPSTTLDRHGGHPLTCKIGSPCCDPSGPHAKPHAGQCWTTCKVACSLFD